MSMSYRPPGESEGQSGRAPVQANEPLSLIDRYTSIEGGFATTRDARVEGMVRGNVECQGLLYVAEGADIDANVEAANITVAGKLNGQVTCRGRLQITSTGRVEATVTTDSLVIEEGAFYEGNLTMEAVGSPHSSGALGSSTVVRRFSGDSEDPDDAPSPRRRSGAPRS